MIVRQSMLGEWPAAPVELSTWQVLLVCGVAGAEHHVF
jgi:hypothetical protein